MKTNKLYSFFFPSWFILLFPLTWLIVLPLDFLRQTLVILVALKILNAQHIFEKYKKVIFKVFLYGLVADFVGISCISFITSVSGTVSNIPGFIGSIGNSLFKGMIIGPFDSIIGFILITIIVVISGFCIYILKLNYNIKNFDIETEYKKKLALYLAIFTAPYIFYYPTLIFKLM